MRDGMDLPLWNTSETDVLPEYRLGYGHMLCNTPLDTPVAVQLLAKHLDIGAMEYAGAVDSSRLRCDPGYAGLSLGKNDVVNLLLSKVNECYCVFGPHHLFFRNNYWIAWNKASRGLMAVISRNDLIDYSYLIFERGKLQFTAAGDTKGLRMIGDTPMIFTLNSEVIYTAPTTIPKVSPTAIQMVCNDLRISEQSGQLQIAEAFRGANVITDVTHYSFRKTSATNKWFALKRR